MASVIIPGQRKWSMTRDKEGHREYKLTHRVRCASTDGPATASLTPGLPLPGSWWLIDNDMDMWAWCRADMTVTPVVEAEPNKYFDVEQTFSTKPPETQRCMDQQIEDPLLEPQQVSGSFTKYTEEATNDRYGLPIVTSSHEQIRGPQNEWDANRPTVKVVQNVANLQLSLLASMIDTVNMYPLWGLPVRCIKLSGVSWEKKTWGTCTFYYTRTFDFDTNYNTFDRDVLDEGNKVLNGHWHPTTGSWILDKINGQNPNSANPQHFVRFTDRKQNPCRVILNGAGLPSDVFLGTGSVVGTGSTGGAGNVHIEKYHESDFLLLGIPTTL